MKYTDIRLQPLQDKELSLSLENIIRGGINSFLGDRYVKSNENEKILYLDVKNLYGWPMSETLLLMKLRCGKVIYLVI